MKQLTIGEVVAALGANNITIKANCGNIDVSHNGDVTLHFADDSGTLTISTAKKKAVFCWQHGRPRHFLRHNEAGTRTHGSETGDGQFRGHGCKRQGVCKGELSCFHSTASRVACVRPRLARRHDGT